MPISKERLKLFLNELAKFENQKNVAKPFDPINYDMIEPIFIKCRKQATKRLRSAISDLEESDPLNPAFFGVSLLRILHGTGLRETAHTRLLTWLLDPSENHGFERLLLLAFMSHITVGKWDMDETLEVTSIQAERMLSGNGRRTDIWIEGTVRPAGVETEQKWLVIVEAKVDSSESEEQLADYEAEAKDWCRKHENRLEPLFVFLSLEGYEGQTAREKVWIPLTFKVLSELLWTAAKNKLDAPGIHMLRYYISGILTDMYGWHLPVKPESAPTNIYSKLGFLRQHH